MKYEYLVKSFVRRNIEEEMAWLNKMGEERWRLVTKDAFDFYYFVRSVV